MSLAVVVAAVVGALILQRQRARHRYELIREYQRLGWEVPPSKPSLSLLESWANILLGGMLTGLAGWFIRSTLRTPFGLMHTGWIELIAVILAAGVTLLWLGVRGWLENQRYHGKEANPRSSSH